ncbi:Tad domain-containing protein [Marivita sp. S6314]|uniref:Tad domain-containing protein n=1 Tax=Marivita sp. S6314 TaxID=2926406 RepID=UPI001FF1DD8F|nr:Tad domain-containing protein [Marivita sp. S6314]MCK0150702.1 Tad domain-containing protein [Marivita sp. S6314]
MIGLSNLLPRLPVGKRKKSALRSSVAGTLSRFTRETDGNMSILALSGSMVMLVFGGVGIDMIYSEVQRTKLQNTLDRAVLAAANLDQELDPELVVHEYFAAMNMEDALSSVTVDQGLSHRIVNAQAERDVGANFLQMLGVDVLHTEGEATAEERIANVEISMVLDISGSMGSNNKIGNLRNAATDFVETVIKEDDSGLTTINVVPYNATVNLGSTVASYYDLEDSHDYSNCGVFPSGAFNTTTLDPTQEIGRLAHFDPWSTSTSNTPNHRSWCADDDYGAIMVHSSDETALTTHIASLGAGGNTAIDLGMKWGVALLDPSARPVVSSMISDGLIVGEASGRPAAYTAEDAIKIAVVMTDGMNTTQYDLKNQFKYGMSDLWIDDRGDNNPGNDRFSLQVRDWSGSSNDVWYWERYRNDGWSSRYRGNPDGGGNARQMTNAEVFARWGTRGYARKFYRKPYEDNWFSYNTYRNVYYAYEATVGGNSADARLSTICQAARDQDITIFAIGFEAPTRGQDAMRDCASSPAHYFAVDGLEISDAFQQIARTINQLRLTQ